MNRTIILVCIIFLLAGCKNSQNQVKRIPLAEVGKDYFVLR